MSFDCGCFSQECWQDIFRDCCCKCSCCCNTVQLSFDCGCPKTADFPTGCECGTPYTFANTAVVEPQCECIDPPEGSNCIWISHFAFLGWDHDPPFGYVWRLTGNANNCLKLREGNCMCARPLYEPTSNFQTVKTNCECDCGDCSWYKDPSQWTSLYSNCGGECNKCSDPQIKNPIVGQVVRIPCEQIAPNLNSKILALNSKTLAKAPILYASEFENPLITIQSDPPPPSCDVGCSGVTVTVSSTCCLECSGSSSVTAIGDGTISASASGSVGACGPLILKLNGSSSPIFAHDGDVVSISLSTTDSKCCCIAKGCAGGTWPTCSPTTPYRAVALYTYNNGRIYLNRKAIKNKVRATPKYQITKKRNIVPKFRSIKRRWMI